MRITSCRRGRTLTEEVLHHSLAAGDALVESGHGVAGLVPVSKRTADLMRNFTHRIRAPVVALPILSSMSLHYLHRHLHRKTSHYAAQAGSGDTALLIERPFRRGRASTTRGDIGAEVTPKVFVCIPAVSHN